MSLQFPHHTGEPINSLDHLQRYTDREPLTEPPHPVIQMLVRRLLDHYRKAVPPATGLDSEAGPEDSGDYGRMDSLTRESG